MDDSSDCDGCMSLLIPSKNVWFSTVACVGFVLIALVEITCYHIKSLHTSCQPMLMFLVAIFCPRGEFTPGLRGD